MFPILENGVTYLVSLDKDFIYRYLPGSTQRAWLTKYNTDTRVLNCFAHTEPSLAAATAGDFDGKPGSLSKRWLDRLPERLQSSGIG
jgi:hypothetical protein